MEHPEKLAGVWLDHHEAHIISNHDGRTVSALRVKGHVTSDTHSGGHGSEYTANNAKVNALHKFFNEILHELTNTDELHLLGTGIAQEQLIHYVKGISQWKKMKVTEESTGKLNAAQALDKVATHFQQRL